MLFILLLWELLIVCGGYIARPPLSALISLKDAVEFASSLQKSPTNRTISSSDSYRLTQAIRIFGDNKQLGSALSLIRVAQSAQIRLNTFHFVALLQTCRQNKQGDIAQAIFEKMDDFLVQKNTLLCNIMISIHAESMKPDMITSVLAMMEEQGIPVDAFSYSSAISGLIKCNCIKEAIVVANVAMATVYIHNTYVLNAVLSAYANSRRWDEALLIFTRSRGQGAALDAASYSIIINALGEAMQFEQAKGVFESMGQSSPPIPRDVGVYNAMITACERSRQWREALGFLARMPRDGIAPDAKAFCSAISCCGAAGQWREALAVFKTIEKSGESARHFTLLIVMLLFLLGVRKDVAVYNALIDTLQRAGKWTLAIDVLREGSEERVLFSNETEYLSAEDAFKRARDVYSLGLADGTLGQWYEDAQQRRVLDLHHFPLSVALTVVSLVFEKMLSGAMPVARLRIITGRGNHVNNSGTRGVLRVEIEAYIHEMQPAGILVAEKVAGNDGCIEVSEECIARWIARKKEQSGL